MLSVLLSMLLTEEPLRILYVGDEGLNDRVRAGRSSAFEEFLKIRFDIVDTANHENLRDEQIESADVVLLDWHQSGGLEVLESPLGDRDNWSKPLVLLGSAGLNLARAWQMRGASG